MPASGILINAEVIDVNCFIFVGVGTFFVFYNYQETVPKYSAVVIYADKDGFVIDGTPGFKLMPFDEVMIRQSPAYVEQQNVSITGEVMFAGLYTLDRRNARLSELFKKAGGATDQAYLKGARIIRKANEQTSSTS